MEKLKETMRWSETLHRAGGASLSRRGTRGVLLETAMFGANPGALRMLSYTPTRLRPKAPLVVLLHGCTQAADGNAAGSGWLQLADRLGFVVLVPEQRTANNLNRCFNWFLASDTQRGLGECASIAQMVDVLSRSLDLDLEQVFITGLSAGGAMAAAMLATYPELFAGGAIIAGLPYGVAHNFQEAMGTMRGGAGQDSATLAASVTGAATAPSKNIFRLSIWQGDKDMIVDPSNAQALIQQWTLAKGALQFAGTSRVSARLTRTTWRNTSCDGATVELNMIAGLGHGTPISTTAPGDVGSPAPFLLECGVSSTLEIAKFWGLDTSTARCHVATSTMPIHAPTMTTEVEAATDPEGHLSLRTDVAAHILGSIGRYVPEEIQDMIAQSLRAAGLLK